MNFLQSLLARMPPPPQLLIPAEHRQPLPPPPPPEEVPTEHALKYRPDWTDAQALDRSHIVSIRERDGPGHLRTSFRLKESRTLFWTSLRLSYNRNVPSRWRMYIWFSEEFEYELMPWRNIDNSTWTLLPSVFPAFYTTPGKIYIEVDIPDEPHPGHDVHMTLRLCGFQNLFPWAPRWDMVDEHGNRLMTWIPRKDSDRSNDATLYHRVYDSEPPFEPNGERLPRSTDIIHF